MYKILFKNGIAAACSDYMSVYLLREMDLAHSIIDVAEGNKQSLLYLCDFELKEYDTFLIYHNGMVIMYKGYLRHLITNLSEFLGNNLDTENILIKPVPDGFSIVS